MNNDSKRMFGVVYKPGIDLSVSEVSLKAQSMAGKLSISGVQPKLSMKLNRKKKELEVVAEGGEYILKPQVATFPHLPQNEYLCMGIAQYIGINVPPNDTIKLKDGSRAYIIKRFDRNRGVKIHQEDFFQILKRKDKYKGSIEEIGKKLSGISEVPGLDVQHLYERAVFFFIIGNGDAHLKNFSIVYDKNGNIRLSPAYDIISSKLVIPNEEDFALSVNGKKNKLLREDFLQLARVLNIPYQISEKFFFEKKPIIKEMINKSLLPDSEKKRLGAIIQERFSRLE